MRRAEHTGEFLTSTWAASPTCQLPSPGNRNLALATHRSASALGHADFEGSPRGQHRVLRQTQLRARPGMLALFACARFPAGARERLRTRRRLGAVLLLTTPRLPRLQGTFPRTVPEEFITDYSFLPLSSYAHFTSNCLYFIIKGRIARKT